MRLSKRELFQAMRYVPHAGQLLVHKSRAQRRVLCCGVRWGKSVCAAMEAVAALLEPREQSIGWIVAPSYDLTERTFVRVSAAIEQYFGHRITDLNSRENRITICNLGGGTSELRGKSADNPSSLLGEGLDFLIVDEAAQLRDFVWHEFLSQRLVDKQGWCALLSTPAGCRSWFYDEFKRGKRGGDPLYESWSSPSWANPHLDRSVIESERQRLPAETFAAEYEAVFVGEEREPCGLCGASRARGCQIVVVRACEPTMACFVCNSPIDEQGRSLVPPGPDGKPNVRVALAREDRRLITLPKPIELPASF